MSSPTDPYVRVVCVTYRPGPELADQIASLEAATTAPYEIVLVENGPDAAAAHRVGDPVGATVILSERNVGYGTAANLGARGATAPWIVVVNPDVVWHPGSLDRLLEAGERSPSAGALGPAVLNLDQTRYPSARALPSLRQGAGHALLGRVWPSNPWTSAYQRSQESTGETERSAGWLSGACLLLRREAFEQVGGFDEDYFMFFEDVDLGERLGRAGWTSRFVPGAQVTHAQGTSWQAKPAAMIRAHHASAGRYLSVRYARWYQLPLRVAIRAGLRIRCEVELRRARTSD